MPTPKTKKFSVSEFQTWLDGIMEFQESGWSPSPEQWKAIYQKIQNLKDPSSFSKKIEVDDSSINEIVEKVSSTIPDFSSLDFELLMNVVNAILNQMRQGGTVMPQNNNAHSNNGFAVIGDVPKPPVDGEHLANIPLSQLRQLHEGKTVSNHTSRVPTTTILENVDDEFV